jgi:hypothetical protein
MTKVATDPKTPTRPRETQLHDDRPNRVTTQRVAIIETKMVKGFHLEA